GSATGSRSSIRVESSRSIRRRPCSPSSGARSSSFASRAARRPRSKRFAGQGSRETKPSPSVRRSPSRCGTPPPPKRLPPSTTSASPQRSAHDNRPWTTSTCGSPAIGSPRPPERRSMSAATATATLPARRRATGTFNALGTLTGRRFHLTARTPRELLVPLLTPIMFALVIAPALKTALHTDASYESYVALGTVGLLIPLNTMFSGLGVIVDRENGAQRELLAAPIPRAMLVLGNLVVASAITALQVAVLIGVATARGINFDPTANGVLWFVAAAGLFTLGID